MYVLVTLTGGLGASLGTSFNITTDVGIISESATLSELLAGKIISVESTATLIIITSVGVCTNSLYLSIYPSTTTTTSSSTTAIPTTTTTTTYHCSYNITIDNVYSVPATIKYGLLYNFYAVNDSRNIANTGWHVPSRNEMQILKDTVDAGDATTGGVKLKQEGYLYWYDFGQTPHTNEVGFNARGAGKRWSSDGSFRGLRDYTMFLTSDDSPVSLGYYCLVGYLTAGYDTFSVTSSSGAGRVSVWTDGRSVRLVRDSTTLSDGEEGTYTGNDGTEYRTICIGMQEWLADNLAETQYRNGEPIPEITDASTWMALTSGAMCAYSNNWNNVFV